MTRVGLCYLASAVLLCAGCDSATSSATTDTASPSDTTSPADVGVADVPATADAADSGPTADAPDTSEDTSVGAEPCFEPTLDLAVCDPATATFSLASTNPYYPLTVGLETILEGTDDEGIFQRVERTVRADTKIVAGVETHILEHRTFHDGEIHEIAYNYYVEASDGTVCYFGEDVEFYEGGELANTDGTWIAGVDGAKPGIIMPASPAAGQRYYQEDAPGVAEDMGQVISIGGTETIGGVEYEGVMVIHDVNPRDSCDDEEPKRYVAGIGEVSDVEIELISYTLPD